MKTLILSVSLILATLTATAQQTSPVPVLLPPQSGAVGLPANHTAFLEQLIQQRLKEKTGFAELQQFSVDWTQNSLKCMQVEPSEMTPDQIITMCEVKAHAFQVEAKAAIIRVDNTYRVSILFANVE